MHPFVLHQPSHNHHDHLHHMYLVGSSGLHDLNQSLRVNVACPGMAGGNGKVQLHLYVRDCGRNVRQGLLLSCC